MKKKKTTFADKLKFIRTYLEFTQEEFAEFMGVSTSLISKLENGVKEPTQSFYTSLVFRTGIDGNLFSDDFDGELGVHLFVHPPTFKSSIQLKQSEPWKDIAFNNLKAEADTWKEKYNELYTLFNNTIAAFRVGKLNPVSSTGLGNAQVYSLFSSPIKNVKQQKRRA